MPHKNITSTENLKSEATISLQNYPDIFHRLVDAVEDYAIFALDNLGHILTWNLGAERLKGYNSSEVIGSHFSRFYTQADKDRHHPAFELKAAESTGKYEEEGWRIRKDGSAFWANVVITAIRDEGGKLIGFGKVARDLTARRKADLDLKESEERFRLMVSHVRDYAIITLDPKGNVSSWNAGAEGIKGYRPDEIIGRHFSAFYPESEILNDKPEVGLRVAAEDGRYEEEGWRKRKDGSMFWANVTITAIFSDGINNTTPELRGFAKVTRDLTSRRQSDEALRESQERYRLLVDNISDYALILLNAQGRITNWNTGATLITGYTPKEILGAHFSKFYPKSALESQAPELELQHAEQFGRFEEEAIRVRKDGTEYWANVVLTVIRDDMGKTRGFSKVTRDLTEKRKAEALLRESEARFRLMVDSVDDYAIFMLDPQGIVMTWNKGAERNKGYTSEEIIGQHFSKFYSNEDKAAQKPQNELKEAIEFGRFEEEGWRLRSDGQPFWANVVITPIYEGNGKLLGFAKVTKNLTEKKRAEDKLLAAYAELESRIAERTKELLDAKVKAESAVKSRERFFSIASHELKTPLSALKLQAQIRSRLVAKGDYSDFAPENLLALCEDDEKQIARLTFLVENMLDVSKISSGKFDLKLSSVNLTQLFHSTIKRLKPILDDAQVTCSFTATADVFGYVDQHRIEQVVTNLMTNVAKYAPGKPLEITLSGDTHTAKFSIRDHGKGITEEEQRKIFDPYERLKSTHSAEGLGLGLYIVHQIIVAHRGQIQVESRPNEGCLFKIQLPLTGPSAAVEAPRDE